MAVRALDEVSVTIRENEFFTLLGPSGCGKTTLLRLIAGFEHPDRGRDPALWRGYLAAAALQAPGQHGVPELRAVPAYDGRQNIGFGLEMLGKPKAEIDATRQRDAALVRMEELKNRRTSQISGGQQQRVALARALAPRPKVLLLDEPLSALDLKLRKDMQIELKRLQHETGITFIFVTHDQEEALTMSDRIAVMSTGRILQIGSPREIYDRPAERFVANFIGETNFLEAESRGTQTATRDGAPGVAVPRSRPTLPEGFDADRQGHRRGAARSMPTRRRRDPGRRSSGTLENIVYFGTDTHYHVRAGGGSEFIVRQQNSRGRPVTASTPA